MTLAQSPVGRLRRRRVKTGRRAQLNLVALMDVFTILVFFFLVHSSDVAQPADKHLVSLPESVAQQAPRDSAVVTITKDMLLFRGTPVTSVEAALNSPRNEIAQLRTALRRDQDASAADASAREVTIMGDKSIPFRLLKKVMMTCTRAGYGRISLAVLQKSGRSG